MRKLPKQRKTQKYKTRFAHSTTHKRRLVIETMYFYPACFTYQNLNLKYNVLYLKKKKGKGKIDVRYTKLCSELDF